MNYHWLCKTTDIMYKLCTVNQFDLTVWFCNGLLTSLLTCWLVHGWRTVHMLDWLVMWPSGFLCVFLAFLATAWTFMVNIWLYVLLTGFSSFLPRELLSENVSAQLTGFWCWVHLLQSEHFPFLGVNNIQGPATNMHCRTTFYTALSRLLMVELGEDEEKFERFMLPLRGKPDYCIHLRGNGDVGIFFHLQFKCNSGNLLNC